MKLLPAPFAWITIPAGKVTLLENHREKESYLKNNTPKTFDVAEFKIAKYPLTNAQYRIFVEADGYNTSKWWTEAGWQQKQSNNWTKPDYWDNEIYNSFNSSSRPIVAVSWYEAIAFCNWMSEVEGENIMLPTEQEWQHAAQSDDSRTYPWGNDWDSSKCQNSVDSKVRKTSPVMRYSSKGDSPFGVVDMAGNVWEWCRTNSKDGTQDIDGTDDRVIHGGGWKNHHKDHFSCVFRAGAFAWRRSFDRGIRLARFNY